jgi:hypothetical protein
MNPALIFIGAGAASLFWSAACTAAGVRCHRPWLRRLLLVLGLLAPLLTLLPWLVGTSMLAFLAELEVNWFGPVLSLFISALIGGGWILKAGTQPHGGGWATVPAASWPVGSLFALFLLAKAGTAGAVLMLDRAAFAASSRLYVEASDLMKVNLPPAENDNTNAAGIYKAAFVLLEEDLALGQKDSPLGDTAVDPTSPAVIDLLDRHAPTLTLLRTAAERDGCRFPRDWTRPSFEMLLPELQHLRQAGRLVRIAALQAAASGRSADAIHDVGLLARISRHAASEPLLISGLVGIAIDAMALDTLAAILPQLTATDRPLLNDELLNDLLVLSPSLTRHFYGEEAFGLRTFAALADASLGMEILGMVQPTANQQPPSLSLLYGSPALTFYRIFLLPDDLAGYRHAMRTQQQIAAQAMPYAEKQTQIAALESQLNEKRPGILSAVILPSLAGALRAEARSQVRHRAAQAAVAATRMRLETGSLPENLARLVPSAFPAPPLDLFTADQPLQYRMTDDALLIYSVGPNGVDDGGPSRPEADGQSSNDDIGLRLSIQ